MRQSRIGTLAVEIPRIARREMLHDRIIGPIPDHAPLAVDEGRHRAPRCGNVGERIVDR
jgi:hypothetical protein